MKRRIISLFTLAVLLCSSIPYSFAALSDFTAERTYSGQFADVVSNAWYYDNVKTAYELGLINGTSQTAFSPTKQITIAEVQTLVARIHSTYYGNTIESVEGAWYAPYVEYCMEHIDREVCYMAYMLDGNAVTANQPASRSYFAYLMYAALPASEYQQINTIPDGSLPDVDDSVFMSAPERIYALYRAGILTGNDAYGTFRPDSNITRAEVAAIIARMIDPEQRKSFTLEQKPQNSLENYLGSWYFVSFPNSGLTIEKSGSDYYFNLTLVQGMGMRVNGTLEPAKLIDMGGYYETERFDTMYGTTAIAQIRPEGNQLIVSCTEYGSSSFSISLTSERCNKR